MRIPKQKISLLQHGKLSGELFLMLSVILNKYMTTLTWRATEANVESIFTIDNVPTLVLNFFL